MQSSLLLTPSQGRHRVGRGQVRSGMCKHLSPSPLQQTALPHTRGRPDPGEKQGGRISSASTTGHLRREALGIDRTGRKSPKVRIDKERGEKPPRVRVKREWGEKQLRAPLIHTTLRNWGRPAEKISGNRVEKNCKGSGWKYTA